MSYYVIIDVRIDEPEQYKAYMAKARSLVEQHGGEYLVRGGEFTVAEGEYYMPRRLVLLRFPDKASFEAFSTSDAYQEARAIRLPVSDMVMIGVEGFDG